MQIVDTDVGGTHIRLLLQLLTPDESYHVNCGHKAGSWMLGFGVGYRPLTVYFFPEMPGWYYLEEKLGLGKTSSLDHIFVSERVAAYVAAGVAFTGGVPNLVEHLPSSVGMGINWDAIVRGWGDDWLALVRAAAVAEREARATDVYA